MSDMLSTGVSGLLAFQRALNTTSHNISNASTDGYSRQVTDLATRTPEPWGNGWLGNGVDVVSVQRQYDDFLATQARTSSSTYQQLDTYATQIGRINSMFGDSSTGLSATLQDFANAVQGVANTPTSVPARQTLLSQAQVLIDRLQGYDNSLRNLDSQVNSQFDTEAATVTTLAQNIAKMNTQIANAYASYGQPPNDLLDQRDKMLDELATHVGVSITTQSDRSVNVFIGTGQPLVIGGSAAKLVSTTDPYDVTRKQLALQSATGTTDVSQNITGGTLGALLSFRTQTLDPARNELGQLTVGLAEQMNQQHAAGMDLSGAMGGQFFALGAVQLQASSANTGTGTVSVTLQNPSAGQLTGADYVLSKTAAGWSLQRKDTGAAVTMTGTGTTVSPFQADGLSIDVSGYTAVNGDRFIIKPTANAVAGLQLSITDPSKVAAAAPIVASAAGTNTGGATISPGTVLNAANPQLRATTTIQFLTPTTYSVNGAGSFTYTSGGNIDINGWRVQVTGTPSAGDTFTIADNTAGVGDNRNALKLADIMNQPVLNNGKTSLNAAAGQFVGDVGVKTNQAQISRDAQKIVHDDSVSAQQAVSGVNLDEEAANLVKYQQAYQAAAQIIKIAQTLFDTLIQAARA